MDKYDEAYIKGAERAFSDLGMDSSLVKQAFIEQGFEKGAEGLQSVPTSVLTGNADDYTSWDKNRRSMIAGSNKPKSEKRQKALRDAARPGIRGRLSRFIYNAGQFPFGNPLTKGHVKRYQKSVAGK
jgi:hypothetical protein